MSGKRINFDNKKINKSNFYKNKKLFNLYDLDVDNILVSKKESYGTKNLLKVLCYLQFLKNTKFVRIVLNHF